MENRVAVIAIVVEDLSKAEEGNKILHENGDYIIGRMGIPHRERGISLISVAMDGPSDAISAVSGRIGAIAGVSAKAVYTKSEA